MVSRYGEIESATPLERRRNPEKQRTTTDTRKKRPDQRTTAQDRQPLSDCKYKEAMKWVGAGIQDPRIEWRSNETQKGIYERDHNNAQSTYDGAVERIREVDSQLKEAANNYASKISQETSRTDCHNPSGPTGYNILPCLDPRPLVQDPSSTR
ncbi:hypothetical protein BDV29DRAFT_119527 [Aspergillus leporis]|uniref:Uncharacterized protein n=1 Tax=Aspergillus leporis TaxID=41062 RepID=A0A5N5X1X3_9EURO|nr:hypothetical protein BDV29DRAFT_119527 [Aspergillus leporis]